MWLFRRPVTVKAVVDDLSRQASRLPLRLRERVAPLGLAVSDAFEPESLALIHAVAVHAIQRSWFAASDRDRLQDGFTLAFADRMLRLRLTGTMFVRHRPLEAAPASEAMRTVAFESHQRLELFSLRDFLCGRAAAYRDAGTGSLRLEEMVDRYLGYLEASWTFEAKFSLAVFVTDSGDDLGHALAHLWRTTYLV